MSDIGYWLLPTSEWISPDQPVLILFIIPISLCAFVGGVGPGSIATVISVLLAEYFLLPPLYTLARFSPLSLQLSSLLLFAGLISSALIDRLRRERARLREVWEADQRRVVEQRASEERCTAIFHAAPVAITIVRLSDGRLVDVNSAHVVGPATLV